MNDLSILIPAVIFGTVLAILAVVFFFVFAYMKRQRVSQSTAKRAVTNSTSQKVSSDIPQPSATTASRPRINAAHTVNRTAQQIANPTPTGPRINVDRTVNQAAQRVTNPNGDSTSTESRITLGRANTTEASQVSQPEPPARIEPPRVDLGRPPAQASPSSQIIEPGPAVSHEQERSIPQAPSFHQPPVAPEPKPYQEPMGTPYTSQQAQQPTTNQPQHEEQKQYPPKDPEVPIQKGEPKMQNPISASIPTDLREYLAKTPVIDHHYFDVVLLGPRNSGKTSIATRWAAPWRPITPGESPSSSREMEVFQQSIRELESKHDPYNTDEMEYGVKRTHVPTLRARIFDIPGELAETEKGMQYFTQDSILVMVLNVEVNGMNFSDAGNTAFYTDGDDFGRNFQTIIRNRCTELRITPDEIKNAFIVFNKVDQCEHLNWNENQIRGQLMRTNQLALADISRTFNNREFDAVNGPLPFLTSAWKNTNIIELLSSLAPVAKPKSDGSNFELDWFTPNEHSRILEVFYPDKKN